MESRCSRCFHPIGAAAGATASCLVCAKASTTMSPFGSSSAKPCSSFVFTPTQSSEPAQSTGIFGVPSTPTTASPSSLFFSPPPPGPSNTGLFQQGPEKPFFAFSPFQASPHPAPENPFALSRFGQAALLPSRSDFTFSTTPFPPPSSLFGAPTGSHMESGVFDDDEPVDIPPAATVGGVQGASSSTSNGLLVLETHCELPAVARGRARDSFAVLVHAKAPAAATDHTAPRASLDLVTVLDVSGSMQGGKLALLKEAMGFVIDKLGPADRLSVVSFSQEARRVTPLMRMSDAGKASAKLAVGELVTISSTNILKGLDMAAKVLDGRRYRNAVASVILLSDGQDNCNQQHRGYNYGAEMSYDYLVPRSLAGSCKDGNRSTPIHTFGFGTDHDAKAMHAIAEATCGTYSFIENQAVVQDAFAQCIGGLLSVAVQEAWITVACPHPDVRIRAIKSGRYESRVLAYGRGASVDVGELYADEERRFLLFVDVPSVASDEDVTRLIRVSCTYKDSATGKSTEVAGEDGVVRRPAEVTSQEDQKLSMEVQVERFRLDAAEDIAAARAAAERGDHAEAARILDRRQEAARSGDLVGDARCAAVVFELAELSGRVATRREYEQTGRSSVLAGLSSHAQQRAASVNFSSAMASTSPAFGACCFAAAAPFASAFGTPAMAGMVASSRQTREERELQQPAWATTTMPSTSLFAANNFSSSNPSK